MIQVSVKCVVNLCSVAGEMLTHLANIWFVNRGALGFRCLIGCYEHRGRSFTSLMPCLIPKKRVFAAKIPMNSVAEVEISPYGRPPRIRKVSAWRDISP